MRSPFQSIIGTPENAVGHQVEPSDNSRSEKVTEDIRADELATPAKKITRPSLGAQQNGVDIRYNSDPGHQRIAVILPYSAATPLSPLAQYLDLTVDVENFSIPIVRFPGTKMVLPDRESICHGLSGIAEEIAPDQAPVIERKDRVPYYIAGTLKDAELKNTKLREQRLKKGQSPIGRQRSAAHIEALGPALFLDDDTDVFAREPVLRALGAAAIVYSSHSYGFPKGDATGPSHGGRVVLFLNRSVTQADYGPIWDAVNHLLGGMFDEHGRSSAQCYGGHARRNKEAPYRRLIIKGAALDADALVALGRCLRPDHGRADLAKDMRSRRKRTEIEEIEHARLMGRVRAPDDYGEWAAGAAAFKRAFPDGLDLAFQCYDAWSACSTKYKGTEATRGKFEQVPAEYDGAAVPLTLEMLDSRARRRAETMIGTLYSPVVQSTDPATDNLADGIPPPKGAEPIPPGSLNPEDELVALEYLLFCWGEKVFLQAVAGQEIPKAALEEAQRRCAERREKIDLAGRSLHWWDGKNLAADTAALAEAVIASDPRLYRVDQTLVRISAPVSDPATADRVRKMHGYAGCPGEIGDPARHAGERLAPILPADSEALREIIAAHVATKRRVNIGARNNPSYRDEIASFGFKTSAKVHEEPDAGVLKDLLKRELVMQVPEIIGVITAPLMPDLPRSTNPDELTKAEADRIVTQPGFDVASGLYLSPLGTIVEVTQTPVQAEVKEAADLLRKPWADFPFVSPGGELSADVSRSISIYAMMIAVNRRALPIAPGIAFSSHGEGMSSGKTLASENICIVATGEVPAPVSLSPDFTEQRKEIITHLIQGDGALFLDNISNGTRFDSTALASAMTTPRYKGRLLGTNKQIEASTRTMVVANGNALNLAGDLASRLPLARLDTGLERPEDRSVAKFTIPDLRRWMVQHRQHLVAAVHTIVRAYLQECRRLGETPADIIDRRQVDGSRFGGPCEVMRDAFLWAFPDLPDPFLSFQASALNSSTKAEAALMLGVLEDLMAEAAGAKFAPAWATRTYTAVKSPERTKWEAKFRARWNLLAPDQRHRCFGTSDMNAAEYSSWARICTSLQIRFGRREVRTGRIRFTSSEIIAALLPMSNERAILEGAMQGRALNPVSLGRWLKERLVDAFINGRVLRCAIDRKNLACFWVEGV